jgi:predicted NAD/FAD-binding protein
MRIGIIGAGGAAICAAWLLDQDHDVTILERRDYIGGDTHTVHVSLDGVEHPIDDGASLFSPKIYPYFNRYLDLTGVAYDWMPGTLTYHDSTNGHITLLPPQVWHRIVPIFTRKYVIPQLWAFLKVLYAAAPIVKTKNSQVTYRQFINSAGISADMEEHFIKPLLTGLWGDPQRLTDEFSVYPLTKYIYRHKPDGPTIFKWKVMHGGTARYIQTVYDQLRRTDIRLRDGATSISTDMQSGKVQVTTASGEVLEFDKLIITSSPRDTAPLIAGSASLAAMHQAMLPFRFYKALLATHSDVSFMPPRREDWSLANVTYDGKRSHATMWMGYTRSADIFCSYISEDEKPQHLHHITEWWLPTETPEFFRAQKDLIPLQGLHNIWLAGAYTDDIGSHESAIISAIRAVSDISPDSLRLKALTAGIDNTK